MVLLVQGNRQNSCREGRRYAHRRWFLKMQKKRSRAGKWSKIRLVRISTNSYPVILGLQHCLDSSPIHQVFICTFIAQFTVQSLKSDLGMSRDSNSHYYQQEEPHLGNQYLEDSVLRSLLKTYVPDSILASVLLNFMHSLLNSGRNRSHSFGGSSVCRRRYFETWKAL